MTDKDSRTPSDVRRVGEVLKARREQRQLPLKDVAEALHLRGSIVNAIETGDYARIDGFDILIAQAQPGHHAGPELLDHDIDRRCEREKSRGRAVRAKIDLQRALAAVEQREVHAVGARARHVAAHLVAAAKS